MLISWVFWKRFEVCKSSKYSSWSRLSDEYKNMGVWIIPCDPTVILRRTFQKIMGFGGPWWNGGYICWLEEKKQTTL